MVAAKREDYGMYRQYVETQIGRIVLEADEQAVTRLGFPDKGEASQAQENEVTRQAVRELKEYLAGKRRVFEVALKPVGTAFQEAVWKELCRIPFGEVSTYGDLAAKVGNPKGARAVGMALNRNPIMIMVPCHRIIGKNGSLTGFGGGLEAKKFLLSLEKSDILWKVICNKK